jgi:hypothetical protein
VGGKRLTGCAGMSRTRTNIMRGAVAGGGVRLPAGRAEGIGNDKNRLLAWIMIIIDLSSPIDHGGMRTETHVERIVVV